MKVHITNIYESVGEIEQRQHEFAVAGQKLGFHELGIQTYQTETDTRNELSARLDGVIAAVEPGDLIIVQLPTGNGIDFEKILIDKLLAYSKQRVLILWQDEAYRAEYRDSIAGYIGKEENIDFSMPYEETKRMQIMLNMVTQVEKENSSDLQEGYVVDDGRIHIGFGLYDKNGSYSVWVGTAMESVIENTDSLITFHILHDDTLTFDNRQKLIQVAKNGGQKIQFHHLDATMFANVEKMMGHFTIGAMFRLLLPDVLLKLPKIIYLDADLFVDADIREMWDTDISDYCIAAVKDFGTANGTAFPVPVAEGHVRAERYFNTGVLVFNLDKIREKGNLSKMVMDYLDKNKNVMYSDQDALNYIFRDECYLLDDKWNYFASAIRKKAVDGKGKIIHYAGDRLSLYTQKDIDRKYYEIMERTPWGTTEGVKLLNASMSRLNDMVYLNENLLHRIIEKKRRFVFYGPKIMSMINTMKLLCVNDENSIWLEKMDDRILENKDEYIVFVLPEAENDMGMKILDEHGWKNGREYYVIPRLVPVMEGGYI